MNATLFEQIKLIINTWDPVELLAIHCPEDEYHSEIRMICTYIEANKDVQQFELGNHIYKVFKEYVGEEFQESIESCIGIGHEIIKSMKGITL